MRLDFEDLRDQKTLDQVEIPVISRRADPRLKLLLFFVTNYYNGQRVTKYQESNLEKKVLKQALFEIEFSQN